jgi:hypothetical protein
MYNTFIKSIIKFKTIKFKKYQILKNVCQETILQGVP